MNRPRPKALPRDLSPSRGVVLVIVLWVLVLLTIAAAALVTDARLEMVRVRERVTALQLEEAARAGVERAVLELSRAAGERRWEPGQRWYRMRVGGIDVRVMIAGARGRVDLNRGDEDQLRAALAAAGATVEQQDRLAAAILRWRGDATAEGPDDADYRAAGKPYLPSKRGFRHVSELYRVLDMPPEIHAGLSRLVTLHGGREVDWRFASGALRRALRDRGVRPPAGTEAGVPDESTASPPYAIRSHARRDDGSTTLIEAVVHPGGARAGRAYHVHAWRRGRAVGLDPEWPEDS